MSRSIRKVAVLVVCAVVALVMASAAQGQQSKEEKAKLTGAELQDVLLKPGGVMLGVDDLNNNVIVVVSHGGGKRDLYWRRLTMPDVWQAEVGTSKIVGDQICTKWTFGPERCSDGYRVGGDKYELWFEGKLYATWYDAQKASEAASKGKVKLTGAQLQEDLSKPSLTAGIDHQANTVWVAEDDGAGKRHLYWRLLTIQGVSGSQTGSRWIAGDQRCTKMTFGPERCFDIYTINESKRESWHNGQLIHTFYRLK